MNTGIVVPAYNESESIAALISDIHKFVPQSMIVIVDDSPDEKTENAIAAFLNEKTHILRRAKKGGRGSAVISGIEFLIAKGCDQILEMDADFSHPPSQIPALFQLLSERNADLLIASRYMAGSRIENWPVSRKIFSSFANKVAKLLLRVPISDYTNGFRVYSARAAKVIVDTCGKRGTGFIALSEILVSLYYRGLKVVETPTIFVNRVRGESSLNFSEIKNAAIGLIHIYLLKCNLQRNKNEHLAERNHRRVE